jgi:hypothetical protein
VIGHGVAVTGWSGVALQATSDGHGYQSMDALVEYGGCWT